MLPGAELRGVERRWSCACGAAAWRSDLTPVAVEAPAPKLTGPEPIMGTE